MARGRLHPRKKARLYAGHLCLYRCPAHKFVSQKRYSCMFLKHKSQYGFGFEGECISMFYPHLQDCKQCVMT